MRPVILYRDSEFGKEELSAAQKYFFCTPTRMAIQKDDLVIGRYSVLPMYKEQERDMIYAGARLVNTFRQHNYIADMRNWAEDLKGSTPDTWYRFEDAPQEGPFVLKGKTYSKKFTWKLDMYAETRADAIDVYGRLSNDTTIGSEDIYIRRYVPLKTYMIGLQDLPITKEFRFFIMYGKVLSGGYYWSNYVDEIKPTPDVRDVPMAWLQTVIDKIGNNTNFYALDVAETAAGDWIVIELNDGQMSGLSDNDPKVLYSEMAKVLNGNL